MLRGIVMRLANHEDCTGGTAQMGIPIWASPDLPTSAASDIR